MADLARHGGGESPTLDRFVYPAGKAHRDTGGQITTRIFAALKPTIAAVNGVAVGFGAGSRPVEHHGRDCEPCWYVPGMATGGDELVKPTQDSTRELRKLVYELARRLDDHTRQSVTELRLTRSQAIALYELGQPLTTKELAAAMYCEPSNATFVVDRLAERGLLVRQPHSSDRRARTLVLTDAGWEMRAELVRRFAGGSPVSHLSEVERSGLEAGLRRALASPDDMAAGDDVG